MQVSAKFHYKTSHIPKISKIYQNEIYGIDLFGPPCINTQLWNLWPDVSNAIFGCKFLVFNFELGNPWLHHAKTDQSFSRDTDDIILLFFTSWVEHPVWVN